MLLLKQSTASSVLVGPVLDSAGASYTGMAIADFNLTKNGTTAAMAASATATHDHNGMYLIAFTTGNTDTLGRLVVSCNKATYAMSAFQYEVLTATTFDALVTNAAGGANGLILSDASNRVDIGKALGTAVTLDANNVLNVSAKYVGGTLQTARDIGLSVLVSSGTGTGQLDFTSGVVKANATQWLGGTIPAVNVTGVPLVDAKYLLGTVFSTPATAGILDANIKNIGNATLSASTAQLGVNVVNFGGSAGTFAGGRAEVNTTHWSGTINAASDTAGYPKVTHKSGSGTGELDITSGVVKANLAQILGTALTETAGLLAGGFKKFFNIATPANTLNDLATPTTAAAAILVTPANKIPVDGSGNVQVDTIAGSSSAGSGLSAIGMYYDSFVRLPGVDSVVGDVQGRIIGDSVTAFIGQGAQTQVTGIDANAVNASALAADATTEIATAVWATATRRLSDGTNIVLAKGVGVTGFNDIAAGAAMTLTSAYDAAKSVNSGTARTAAVTNAADQIQLATTAPSADDVMKGNVVYIASGTGVGQSRVIWTYTGSTRLCVTDRDWVTSPDATSVYVVLGIPSAFMTDDLQYFMSRFAGAGGNPPYFLTSADNDGTVGITPSGYIKSDLEDIRQSSEGDGKTIDGFALQSAEYYGTDGTDGWAADIAATSGTIDSKLGTPAVTIAEDIANVSTGGGSGTTENLTVEITDTQAT